MSTKVAYLTGSDVVVLLDCEEIPYSTGHVPTEEILEARNLAVDIFEDLDHLAVVWRRLRQMASRSLC